MMPNVALELDVTQEKLLEDLKFEFICKASLSLWLFKQRNQCLFKTQTNKCQIKLLLKNTF